jgi:hypothetical protein
MHQANIGTRVIAAAAVIAISGAVLSAQFTGPSSSRSSYILPVLPVVKTASILTVGDAIGGYRMADIPDGLGAFDNGDIALPAATAKDQCTTDGWDWHFRADGGTFKNQGDCIQYANTGK